MIRLRPIIAAAASAALLLAACGSDDEGSGDTTEPSTPQTITVTSANFSESQVLAEIYALALERSGVRVQRQPSLERREVYYDAIAAGQVDLVPEYTNSLLTFVVRHDDPDAALPDATTIEEQVEAIQAALPENLTVGAPSTAEDKDVIVCTKEVAESLGLTNLSDLGAHSAEIKLGAPPEFEARSPFGIAGFREVYGATEFEEFVPLANSEVSAALEAGSIDCGNIFSTNPDITTKGFVALEDDKTVVPHEAVLPLLTTSAATPEVLEVLDAVSASLTTDVLKQLVVSVDVDKKAPEVVASEYIDTLGGA